MAHSISWISPVLKALESINDPHWSFSQQHTFYFNRLKKKRLFLKVGLLKLILPKFEMHVPEDAEIYLRPEKTGIIIVAPQEKKVLKLFLDKSSIEQLNREIEVLKKISGTEFEPYTNKLISYGNAGEGRWLLVGYMKQEKPLDESYLFQHSRSIMDKMSSFYRIYGVESVVASEWLKTLDKDIQMHPQASDLLKLREFIRKEIERVGDTKLIISNLHADLHKENIMLTSSGEKIFDWEGTTRSLVLMDYFDFLRRYLAGNEKDESDFWSDLQKGIIKIPKYHNFFEQFKTWYHSNFKIEVSHDQMRLLFMIYALDRTCSLMRIEPPRYTKKHLFEMQKILEVI